MILCQSSAENLEQMSRAEAMEHVLGLEAYRGGQQISFCGITGSKVLMKSWGIKPLSLLEAMTRGGAPLSSSRMLWPRNMIYEKISI